MVFVVVVSNKPKAEMKTLRYLPFPKMWNNLYIASRFGYGPARNQGAEHFGTEGLMVQLNDDLALSPDLWNYARTYRQGEFGFQVVNEWVCSRVFIIHLEDYWKIGGCDNSIKFAFEDGDFYLRAIEQGLKFKPIPNNMAIHMNHPHSWWSMKNIAKIDNEWSRLFVKYKRNAKHNMFAFFIRPFHWKVVVQHFVLKVFFVNYWLLRGLIRWKK